MDFRTGVRLPSTPPNDDSFPNEVIQQFEGLNHLEVIVSDLTYVGSQENGIMFVSSLTFTIEKSLDTVPVQIRLHCLFIRLLPGSNIDWI